MDSNREWVMELWESATMHRKLWGILIAEVYLKIGQNLKQDKLQCFKECEGRSELYNPVGEAAEVNEALCRKPELINEPILLCRWLGNHDTEQPFSTE